MSGRLSCVEIVDSFSRKNGIKKIVEKYADSFKEQVFMPHMIVNEREFRGASVKWFSKILTIKFSIFIPQMIPFVQSPDDKRGIVKIRFENMLGANRRFQTPKLTTSEELTVDLLRSKPSICKLEIVDLAKSNWRFAFFSLTIRKLSP